MFQKGHKINNGRKFTEEHRKNLGLRKKGNKYLLGKHWKVKDSSKMGVKKGHIPWNKGLKGQKYPNRKKPLPFTDKHKENLKKAKKINPSWNKGLIGYKAKEQHYNWQNGKSFEPYTTDWTKTLKKSIKERDHYICQLCLEEGDSVHHIDYNKKNCNPDNLITLCRGCNSKVNFNRKYWQTYFSQKIYGIYRPK